MFGNKNNHESNGANNKDGEVKVQEHKLVKRANTLDEGIIAFGEWLASRDSTQAACSPLSFRKFIENMQVLIFDKELGKEVHVEIIDGVPECKTCTDSDCIHIGFSICVLQIYRRDGIVNLT
jgi:hypothetical protein